MRDAHEAARDRDLIAAHDRGDSGRLAELYFSAAQHEEASGQIEAACFFLTHAYVFALEAGSHSATFIVERLRAYNREP